MSLLKNPALQSAPAGAFWTAPVALAADTRTEPIDLRDAKSASISVWWTNSGVGSFFLEVSNDGDPPTDSSFATLPTSQIDTAALSPAVWNLNAVPYRWVRVFYDRASGTIDAIGRATLKD